MSTTHLKSDEENRDKVIPIWMIRAINREEPLQEGIYVANANIHQGDMVSVRDITPTEEESIASGNTDRYLDSSEGYDSDGFHSSRRGVREKSECC